MACLQRRRRAGFLAETGLDVDAIAPQVKDKFASAFIRARKAAGKDLLRPGMLFVKREGWCVASAALG